MNTRAKAVGFLSGFFFCGAAIFLLPPSAGEESLRVGIFAGFMTVCCLIILPRVK